MLLNFKKVHFVDKDEKHGKMGDYEDTILKMAAHLVAKEVSANATMKVVKYKKDNESEGQKAKVDKSNK